MYHYGWLREELTLLSEMDADVMDVNRCNSAKEFPVTKFCFFDFVGVTAEEEEEERFYLAKQM